MKPGIRTSAVMAAVLLLSSAGAYWLGSRSQIHPSKMEGNVQKERRVLYWFDPMVPQQHFDKPGKSPFMDMDLVPKYADEADASGVAIPSASVQSLGVRTQVVEVAPLVSKTRVSGSIAWDQRASRDVSARVDGLVHALHVRAIATQVRKGQVLAELIAPQWNSAAQEYLALQSVQSAEGRALRAAARDRLQSLGMSSAQIGAIRRGGNSIALLAPADGVVSELAVREGQSVQAGMSLMRLNGLDTVWVEAAIPQSQAALVKDGASARLQTSVYPGEEFSGKVELLPMELDARTRTLSARIVLENPGHRLLPGMFAEVEIEAAPGYPHPLVPDGAVIATGDDHRVMIESQSGRFVPLRVVIGRSAGGRTEVLTGLEGGEHVVVNGQFLIDSEASLEGALERMSTPGDASTLDQDHHDMQQSPGSAHEHAGHAMPDVADSAPKSDQTAAPDPHAGHDHGKPADPEPQP